MISIPAAGYGAYAIAVCLLVIRIWSHVPSLVSKPRFPKQEMIDAYVVVVMIMMKE